MVSQSRIYPICIFCVWVLIPSTLYAMIANMFLISTRRIDEVIRPNAAIMLTTSFLSLTFMISWTLAIGNALSRVPPPSGKKAAFSFLVLSTIFWIASMWTGLDVSRKQPMCREGASPLENPASWSDGLSCRMHRLGVAFSVFGCIASLVILGSMIEISDRAFGGISTEAKLRWTTEKFREALIEITEMTDSERGYNSRSDSVRSSQSESVSAVADTPTSSISFSEMNFHGGVGTTTLAKDTNQEDNDEIDVTKEKKRRRRTPLPGPKQ